MYKSNVYKRGEIYKTRSINKAAWEDTLSHPKPKATQKKSIYLLSSYSVISYTIVPKNMTMLKNKRITFSLIFVCLVMVSPVAKAQLGGLGGLLGGGGGGGGLGGLLGGGGLGGLLGNGGLGGLLGGGGGGGVLGGILGLINIQGVLRCSANGNVSAPAFVSKLSKLILLPMNQSFEINNQANNICIGSLNQHKLARLVLLKRYVIRKRYVIDFM